MKKENKHGFFYGILILSIAVFIGSVGCSKPELGRVEVAPEKETLSIGSSMTFKAVPRSTKGEEMPGVPIQWRVEGEAGSIDTSGVFTAEKPGEATIIARADGITGQAIVTVKPRSVTKINIEPETVEATVEGIVKFHVKGFSKDDLPAGYNHLSISTPTKGALLDTETVTLNDTGQGEFNVTLPPRPGEISVVVASNGIKKEVKIIVAPLSVERIEIEPTLSRALAESSVAVKIKAIAANGKTAGYNFVSVSSRTEGTKLSSETVTLGENGQADFMVTLSPRPGENILVLNIDEITEELRIVGTEITRLEINPKEEEYEIGQKVIFKATGYDEYGNGRSVDPVWSLSGTNAVLEKDGRVTMKERGAGILFAEYNDIRQGEPFTVVPGKVAQLTIEPQAAELSAGESITFNAQALNAQGYPLTARIQWSVEGDVGRITKDGTFLGKRAGQGKVVAASGEVTGTSPVKVAHGSLSDISIKLEETTLKAGHEVTLIAEGVDAYGNRFSITPQWFLSASLGKIKQEESLFVPLHAGSGELLAKVGNILSGAKIQVTPADLERIEIQPRSVDIIAGQTTQFQVNGYDRFGNSVKVEPRFSIDHPLGVIDSAGVLMAEKSGSAMVTAQVKELVARSSVAVAPAEIQKATITPEGPFNFVAGKTQVLSAVGFDKFGNPIDADVVWAISPDLCTIDKQGVLSPEKVGKGTLSVTITQRRTGKQLSITREISIAPGETARIEITPESARIVAGEEILFSAATYDQFGNETDVSVNWRLEKSELGKLSQDGLFNAVKSGTGQVSATYRNVIGSAAIELIPAEATFLKILPEEISVQAGERIQLRAIIEDRFGNVCPGDILWSLTNERLGVVTEDNMLIGRKAGQGSLIATFNNIVERAPLTVKTGPLHLIELEPEEQVIQSGLTTRFKATGFDIGGNPLAIDFQWSVDEQIGSIDNNGVLRAVKAGKKEVEVSFGDIKATSTIIVVPGTPANISLHPEQFTITAGETQTLSFEVHDDNGNLIPNPSYQWRVEKELGGVTDQNVFKANKAGEGLIHLIAGEASAQIPVRVVPGKINSIMVKPHTMEMAAGQNQTFSSIGFDVQGNEIPLEPVWSVSGNIGTVDEKGNFQARMVGQGFVLIRMDNVTGLAEVTVTPGPVHHVVLSPKQATLNAGEEINFSATAYDAFENVTPATFSWSIKSEQHLGQITPGAVFRAEKTGKGTIVATADGVNVNGNALVNIEPGDLKNLVLSPEQINLRSGEQLKIAVKGKDGHGNDLLSVDPVITIQPRALGRFEKDALFTALKAGSGRLTAKVGKVETSVPVNIETGILKTLEIELPEQNILAGKTYQLKSMGYDKGRNVVPAMVAWAVTKDVGRIEKHTGIFHAQKAGKGLLVARNGDIVAIKSIEVKPGELYSLFIDPNPIVVKADTIQAFTVSGFDIEENPVPVSVSLVDWEIIGGIGKFEGAGVFRGTKMGKGKVVAKTGILMAESYVTTIPGDPEFSNSRIRIVHPNLPADGTSYSDVLLDVRDKYHNPVSDVGVTLVSSRQIDTIVQPAVTDNRGRARGRISSTQPGTSVIRAVVKGPAFTDTAKITFE